MALDNDIDDFLSKVSSVEQQINDLITGKTTVDVIEDPREALVDTIVKMDPQTTNSAKLKQAALPTQATVLNSRSIDYSKWDKVNEHADADSAPWTPEAKGFAQAIEADVAERAKVRKAKETEANVLKDKGNKAFSQQKYTEAADLYTQGLDILKDHVVLLTNRAQTYLKLQRYEEAIRDCSTALYFEPHNVKALMRRASANKALDRYQEAIADSEAALKVAPENKEVKSALESTQIEMRMHQAEESIKQVSEGQGQGQASLRTVDKLMAAIETKTNLPENVARLLLLLTSSDECRVYFRAAGHLRTLADLKTAEALAILSSACTDNTDNVLKLVEWGTISNILTQLPACSDDKMTTAIICLLEVCCTHEKAQIMLASQAKALLWMARLTQQPNSNVLLPALATLHVASFHAGVRAILRSVLAPMLIESLLNLLKPNNPFIRGKAAELAAVLCSDEWFRPQAVSCGWIEACLKTPTPVFEVRVALQIIDRLSLEEQGRARITGAFPWDRLLSALRDPSLSASCASILSRNIKSQDVRLLSFISQHKVSTLLVRLVAESKDASSPAVEAYVRALATLAKTEASYVKEMVDSDMLSVLPRLLSSSSTQVSANASLCLADCATADERVIERVRGGPLVDQLVDIAHKHTGPVQKNAAIALARLARDKNILERVRELHGIEILYHYVK